MARRGPAEPLLGPPAWRVWLRRALANRGAVAGAIVSLLFVLVAVLAPWLAPYDPLAQDLGARLQPPGANHWLGTDDLGRDVLSRLIAGAGISLQVGLLSVSLAFAAGAAIGLCAGYAGGWVDEALMRLVDVLMAFPTILLAILVVAILGPSLTNAMLAVAIVNVPTYARLVRASALVVARQEYVSAARALGAGHARIALLHVFPNCLTPLVVQATLGIAAAILETAGLSFLGLGAQVPAPEWGAMLNGSRAFIRSAPWTVMFPGLAIMAVVLGFNLLGDGLRDLLDPRSGRQ
ncbi:MAG: ABC transporter permease [Candidatus Sericytochromatia bacterium]|nr:ABC transporter permease [Candidatus Tanganyikabacteria bacterium]